MPTPLKRQISGTAVIYSYKIMFLHTPLYQGNLSKRNNFAQLLQLRLFSVDMKIISILLYPTFFSTCDKVSCEEFCTLRIFLKALSVLGFFKAINLDSIGWLEEQIGLSAMAHFTVFRHFTDIYLILLIQRIIYS